MDNSVHHKHVRISEHKFTGKGCLGQLAEGAEYGQSSASQACKDERTFLEARVP